MISTRFLPFLTSVFLSASGMPQTGGLDIEKQPPPRVFIHTRGKSMDRPFMDSWAEGGTIFMVDPDAGKSYAFDHEELKETSHRPPPLKDGWKGQLKFRRGAWWFLQFERGGRTQDRVSSVFRFDAASKSWSSRHRLEVRVSNFEVMEEDRLLLFGIFSPEKGAYFLAGTVSATSPSVNLLDEAPIKRHFPDLFWKDCITSVDDQMAYAYFPFSGHLYGYDKISHSFREFRVPWTPLSDESINQLIEAATASKQRDCFISATDHPSSSHCYFLPMAEGRMAFIYQVLDEETEKRLLPNPDGTHTVVERVSSLMLFPDDPQLVVEMTTPSSLRLARWCWSATTGRLVRIEERLVPREKPGPSVGKRIK